MKTALITGVLGQDGSYMAELLYSKGYEVHGVIRSFNDNKEKVSWIRELIPDIKLYDTNLIDKKECLDVIKHVKPNEIYNFAGMSNIFNPFNNLDLIFDLNCKIPCNILTSIVEFDKSIKLFQASSCLIFGRTNSRTQNEDTPIKPVLPYGVTKAYTDNMINEFRHKYGIFACSGIFFNHDSERRGDLFFTKKIINSIFNIVNGESEKIKVGNLNTYKDMGYAPNFMEAVFLMMQNKSPKDYVIGTGDLIKLSEFVKFAFKEFGLNWEDHIEVDENLYRDNESEPLLADISNIKKDLGWEPNSSLSSIVKRMIGK